ncbi:MAG TPA: hypothetical protein P5044_10075 [bacterium]|nr:hypothetical protein [bacterium]
MKWLKAKVLPVAVAALWIGFSEFLRNEFLLKRFWTEHYKSLGLDFPSGPVNGAVWMLWSLVFAIVISVFLRKFTFIQAAFLAWITGFVMMWMVIYNLGVLPAGIFYLAIPLSLLEAFIAALILRETGN